MNTAQRTVELAQIRPGDHITVSGWPPMHLEVIDASDPALLLVRGPSGRELKIGRLVVATVQPSQDRNPKDGCASLRRRGGRASV